MDSIIGNVRCLLHQNSEAIKQEILRKLNFQNEDDVSTVNSVFNDIQDCFAYIGTDSLQKRYIESHVKPLNIVFGKVLTKKRKVSKFVIVEKEESFIYIPILQSLEQLLSNSAIKNLLLRKPHLCTNGVFL